MTRIVIDDVDSVQDLLNALAYVHHFFASDTAKFESPEEHFSKSHAEACACDACITAIGVKKVSAMDAGPLPYVPCPGRGTHLRLTECWACWSDVYRGACLETDVLAAEAWDIAVGELVARADVESTVSDFLPTCNEGGRHRAFFEPLCEASDYFGRHRAETAAGEAGGTSARCEGVV